MARGRGRNSYTMNNVKRAIRIAREAGLDRVEVETEGVKYVFPVTKGETAPPDQDEPEDIVELLRRGNV